MFHFVDFYIHSCFIFFVGESDGYSITSSLSRRSSSARSRAKSARATRPVTGVRPISTPSDDDVRPRTVRPATALPGKPVTRSPLTESLFPNIPPTIHFETEGFKGTPVLDGSTFTACVHTCTDVCLAKYCEIIIVRGGLKLVNFVCNPFPQSFVPTDV